MLIWYDRPAAKLLIPGNKITGTGAHKIFWILHLHANPSHRAVAPFVLGVIGQAERIPQFLSNLRILLGQVCEITNKKDFPSGLIRQCLQTFGLNLINLGERRNPRDELAL